MECKRDGLASIGEALSSLDGPGKKTLQTSPQSRHHFTQAAQVNALVGAEAPQHLRLQLPSREPLS